MDRSAKGSVKRFERSNGLDTALYKKNIQSSCDVYNKLTFMIRILPSNISFVCLAK